MYTLYLHTHVRTWPPSHAQDGVEVQKETSLDELWQSAMDAYSNEDWQTVVDQLEEAIPVFNAYQNSTLVCLQQCSENSECQSAAVW